MRHIFKSKKTNKQKPHCQDIKHTKEKNTEMTQMLELSDQGC